MTVKYPQQLVNVWVRPDETITITTPPECDYGIKAFTYMATGGSFSVCVGETFDTNQCFRLSAGLTLSAGDYHTWRSLTFKNNSASGGTMYLSLEYGQNPLDSAFRG